MTVSETNPNMAKTTLQTHKSLRSCATASSICGAARILVAHLRPVHLVDRVWCVERWRRAAKHILALQGTKGSRHGI
jgi:hypothetical protein